MSVWLSAAVGDAQVRAVTDVDGAWRKPDGSIPCTCRGSSNDGEGTPTLEIAYFAPGAEQSFATGANGSAQPVPHLTNLCAAGALGYMGALAFGDGAANGCPCYSEAGKGFGGKGRCRR